MIDGFRVLNISIMLKCLNIRTLLIFFKYLIQHQQNKCVCVSWSHSVTLRKKIPKYYVNLQKIRLAATTKSELCMQIFFSKITNIIYLPCVFIHHPASPDVLPIPCFSVPALFFLPFLPIEVFPSRSALNNALSFIHDILITNSVINTLPDQCLSSIMADRCGLMLHKELDGLLRTNSNVAGLESSIVKGDRRRIPGWRPCFQRIIKQLVLFVTVTAHLSFVDC